MYQSRAKKYRLIRRSLLYGGMTVTVVSTVAVLAFVVLGYQFDTAEGKLEQGGLVQFESKPGGVAITIDGINATQRTPAKSSLLAGTYNVRMSRPGYHSWSKTVQLHPGGVLWLNYARLIPLNSKPQSAASFGTVSSSARSDDSKLIAIKTDPSTPEVILADVTGDTVAVSQLVLPETLYTLPKTDRPRSFVVNNWDANGRYVLLRHMVDDKVEWLVADINDIAASKNITLQLGIDAESVKFSNRDSRVLYALVGADIRRIDLNQMTISGPLVRDVAEFALDEQSTLVYITKYDAKTKQRSVGYYTDGASKPRVIRSYDGEQPNLHAAMGKYFDQSYVAISSGTGLTVEGWSTPPSDAAKSLKLTKLASLPAVTESAGIDIHTKGRFVTVRSSTGYSVYDMELTKFTTTRLVEGAVLQGSLLWCDSYVICHSGGGHLRVYEFDGENQRSIMPAIDGQAMAISPNGKYMYGFHTKDGSTHLMRVKLIQ